MKQAIQKRPPIVFLVIQTIAVTFMLSFYGQNDKAYEVAHGIFIISVLIELFCWKIGHKKVLKEYSKED